MEQSLEDGRKSEIIVVDICHSSGCLASNFLSYSIPVPLWDLSLCVALGVRDINRADGLPRPILPDADEHARAAVVPRQAEVTLVVAAATACTVPDAQLPEVPEWFSSLPPSM